MLCHSVCLSACNTPAAHNDAGSSVDAGAIDVVTTNAAAATVDAGAPGMDAGALPTADAGETSEQTAQERFASALTGHRRKAYTGDLDNVTTRGVLRVLSRNNSTSYFLYKGVEAGFDYELAKWLAKDLGVRLEMVVAPTRRELVPWLLDGHGDVILAGLSTDAARSDRVRFTRAYLQTNWVVVMRKKDAPRHHDLDSLKGKEVLVRPSSGAMTRLRAQGVSGLVISGALEGLESEDLLDSVADKKAAATVVEERIAMVELLHRSDLAIAFVLPGGEDVAAPAVRKEDVKLWDAIDAWVAKNRRSTDWNIMYQRVHENVASTGKVRDDKLRADRDGRISAWDPQMKAAGTAHDVDWRLIAAQCYQESRFDLDAKSAFGAVGIMQLLPSTAKELGCRDPKDPDDAIVASSKFIGKLMKRYGKPDIALKDRVRFALAAYNAGPGHLDDARVLAEQEGLDRNRWFGNVERAMLLLSKPRYYQKAAHGFARADETVRYVSEIQTRYDAYVALTK